MARGRFLNKTVTTDDKVADLTSKFGAWACLFHHRLIAFLDVNGNVRADEYWLKATIFPRESDVLPEHCRNFSDQLAEVGLALTYEHKGMRFLHFPNFTKNQHGLRTDKERPEYPDYSKQKQEVAKPTESFPTKDGTLTEKVGNADGTLTGISLSLSLSPSLSLSKQDSNRVADSVSVETAASPQSEEQTSEPQNESDPEREAALQILTNIQKPRKRGTAVTIGEMITGEKPPERNIGPQRILFNKIYKWAGIENPQRENDVQLFKIIGAIDVQGLEMLIDDFVDRNYSPTGNRFDCLIAACWETYRQREQTANVINWTPAQTAN